MKAEKVAHLQKGSKGQKREIEREMGLERGKGMVMSKNHISVISL